MLTFRHLLTRVALSVGAPLALLVAAGGVVGLELVSIQHANERMEAGRLRMAVVSDWIGHVRGNLDRAILSTQLDAAIGDDEAARGKLALPIAKLVEGMSQAADNAASAQQRMALGGDVADPRVQALVDEVAAHRTRFVAARAQIRDDLLLGEGQARIDAELTPLAVAMTRSLDRLQAHIGERAAETAGVLEADVRKAQLTLLGGGLLALLCGGLLAWRITRSIVAPITEATRFAQEIAGGGLAGRLDVQGRDEIAGLQRALLGMRDVLAALVGDVRASADSIHVASSEVAHGNADLSQRTERAAASLQQTAGSMTQLTGTVRQSSDAAAQANQMAHQAAQVAQRGGEVVSQVVTTMQDIHASSSRIADIIGTIDGIAFQTNILALNAAVEAARAGEQGRGFAVVASEVRSLAGRSAAAAREIKALIGSSVDRVEAGSRLVADAGRTMHEIVASVQRVSSIIGDISAASGGQSQDIGQVNVAVGQLDQMTQQNAALVEQSAAAALSLQDQAGRLAQVVAAFRLQPATA